MKFRKKPIVIEATQWFKNGDHPKDFSVLVEDLDQPEEKSEGGIVRRFRHYNISDQSLCKHCGKIMHIHGWVETLEGGHLACPGDWIITGINGEVYPCKPDIFAKTYEAVKDV